MNFRFRSPEAPPVRFRVTPDPTQAEALKRKFDALKYAPETAFHRDQAQVRVVPRLRLVR